MLSADEAQEACGSPRAVGGLLLTRAGSVQPALLVQGLRRLAVEAGVRVFEASPMTRLQRSLPAVVETPAGKVVADQVVLTCGPWLAGLRELRRTLFIIPSHVVATAPAADALDAMGWRRGRPFADARTAVHYGQRTGDDRLVFGRGGGRLGFARAHRPGALSRPGRDRRRSSPTCTTCCRGRARPAIEWQWGGPVERTQHGTPWVGALGAHGNIHYGTGFSGNGVCPTQLIGRTLASVALGLADDYAVVAARQRAALVPAARTRALAGRARCAGGHQPLRGAGRQGARARSRVAARQPRPRLLDAAHDQRLPGRP